MLKACVFLFAPVGRVTACSGEAMRYLATGASSEEDEEEDEDDVRLLLLIDVIFSA